MLIHIAVCDDEPKFATDLKNKIQTYMTSKAVSYNLEVFFNGENLLQSDKYFDIIFLDIKMDRLSGMQTAKALREQNINSAIIFVTALKEYVFEAFEVEAANFFVKPVDIKKLNKALEKIVSEIKGGADSFLILKKGQDIKKIYTSNIMYCEVVNHIVSIFSRNCVDDYNEKIDKLETELGDTFFRCHRKYIVNLKYVKSYSGGIAYLTNGEKVLVSVRKQPEFARRLLCCKRDEVR